MLRRTFAISFALAAVLVAVVGCGVEPTPPQSDSLWLEQPAAAHGATTIQLTVRMGRAADVAYSVYESGEDGMTAAKVREDAAGTGGREPEKTGTFTLPANDVGSDIEWAIEDLPSGKSYVVYLAATPATDDPPAPDLETMETVSAELPALQAAVSYTSAAAGATVGATVGYYEYAPEDHYLRETEKFPLLIFLHGAGEKGNGTTELSRVLAHGPPKLIKNGRTFPFVVISPQLPATLGGWPVDLVDELIARAKADFRIDTTRIYVTGLSLGGYGTWAYAVARPQVVAAAVPIAGAGSTGQACQMRTVPVWAFHGDADGTVNVSGSVNMIDALNDCSPGPTTTPKLTIYPGVGHDSWTRTYDGSAGHDIYAWMLNYTR